MISIDYDDERAELAAVAKWQRQQQRRATQCQCDVEFGTCPGPNNCLNSGCYEGEEK